MEKKFTQGEWKIEHEFNISAENGRSIASAGTYSSNVNPEQVREENIANAKLIAAAPDLLEALERVNHTLNAHGKVEDNTPLHEFIQAAIKKATE